jgi:hypothetical protein
MLCIQVDLINVIRINICDVKKMWLPHTEDMVCLEDLMHMIHLNEFDDIYRGSHADHLCDVEFKKYLMFIHNKLLIRNDAKFETLFKKGRYCD